jgi:heptosyltransferase I
VRVLLVKLSSMGDVIHNFPVVTDLVRAFPGIEIHWVTEAPYVELVSLHQGVKQVFPVHLRALKKKWYSPAMWQLLFDDKAAVVQENYDAVLDTQGLIKSALIARWGAGAKTPIMGYSRSVVREPLAARFYHRTFDISRAQHAVARNRALAAAAFGYVPSAEVDYGISAPRDAAWHAPHQPYAVLLHATSRADKQWPQLHWIALGKTLNERGIHVVLPWGNPAEKQTSEALAAAIPMSGVPPSLSLVAAASLLAGASHVVGVDTGLTHLAVALQRPTVGIYTTTLPELTGLFGGMNAINLGGGTPLQPHVPSVGDVAVALKLDDASRVAVV